MAVPALAARGGSSLRAAVIGHTGRGNFGHGLESIFRGRPGIELVAVVDPVDEARARTVAATGAARGYADYREMLREERPHLVSIGMRHADQHLEIGLACLRAGAHLYVEKPFVRDAAEGDELLAEAGARGVKIAVAHTVRMHPGVVALRQAVREGMLGDLREVRAWGKQDHRAGGEDMMVLGSHLFDLMRMFCGDPEWVSATVLAEGRDIRREDRRLTEDNVGWVAGDRVTATFGFADGLCATFTSDGRLRETLGPWGLELLGSRGEARVIADVPPHGFVRSTGGWSAEGIREEWRPVEPASLRNPPGRNPGPVGDWLEAISEDREPECSGRNGAWAVEMVMGVYASALARRRVAFPLEERGHPLGDARKG